MARWNNKCVAYFEVLNSEDEMIILWFNYSLAMWQSLGGVNKKLWAKEIYWAEAKQKEEKA